MNLPKWPGSSPVIPAKRSNLIATASKSRANHVTSRETVEQYLLYQAAELTRQKCYDGFYIVGDRMQSEIDIDTLPTTYPRWGPTWNFYGAGYGWNTFDPYVGAACPTQQMLAKNQFAASAVIKMYRGQPPMGVDYTFNASAVMARLGDSVQMPQSGLPVSSGGAFDGFGPCSQFLALAGWHLRSRSARTVYAKPVRAS